MSNIKRTKPTVTFDLWGTLITNDEKAILNIKSKKYRFFFTTSITL